MPVSAIIPTLNEEVRIGDTIEAAWAAGIDEIIVADGGSTDSTVAIALAHGARVLSGERMRARQLNRGAHAASHETLLFLHADTLLPAGACDAITRAMEAGFDCGGFGVTFLEGGPRLAYVAFMINARTRLTRAPWGDQAHFFRRAAFPGYPEIPIMEDYVLARRMKHVAILPLKVRTSGRRFLAKGVIRTSILNWLVIAGYHLGVSPERLAAWYRR
ncbi:MAG: TIGR04283 family arsenosugar biosynthesis glycosyltransferase [Acidobacteriota bacterium]